MLQLCGHYTPAKEREQEEETRQRLISHYVLQYPSNYTTFCVQGMLKEKFNVPHTWSLEVIQQVLPLIRLINFVHINGDDESLRLWDFK